MKVQNESINIFMGDTTKSQRSGKTDQTQNGQAGVKQGSISAKSLNLPVDDVAERRKEARQKALKIVQDVFSGDQGIDNSIKEMSRKAESLKDEIGQAKDALADIEKSKSDLQEKLGITDESQEQRDLELLQKRRDASEAGSGISLTENDLKELERIDGTELTDYQKRSLELDESGEPYKKVIENNENEVLGIYDAIKSVNKERLKSNPMLKAQKEADKIIESTEKEIKDMMLEEAKDHIDEEQDKVKEEAEKKAEEEKEQEEKIENVKEKKEQIEALADKNYEGTKEHDTTETSGAIDQFVQLDQIKTDVTKEVKEITDKLKLLAEDIKGAAVDTLG